MENFEELRHAEYIQRQKVNQLRQQVFSAEAAEASLLMDALLEQEAVLIDMEQNRAQLQEKEGKTGKVMSRKVAKVLGAESTGLSAEVFTRMSQVPTGIYHLMDVKNNPLLSGKVKNFDKKIRRIRVISFIDGYSAQAIDTFELAPNAEASFDQLPTLFPERVHQVDELTRATLNVRVEDLDTEKVELHKTYPIWLLARTTAPLAVLDPKTGQWNDLTPYLGAFVTPNARPVMEFLRKAAALHPDGQLAGYQGDPTKVEPQIKAIYDALKEAGVTYINSVIDFSPDDGTAGQRVRLPADSLGDKGANCLDGTLLLASLLEAVSMSPGIVIIPGHAFLAYESWSSQPGKPAEWRYLETTMIAKNDFQAARDFADQNAKKYEDLMKAKNNPSFFRRHAVRELRSQKDIFPAA